MSRSNRIRVGMPRPKHTDARRRGSILMLSMVLLILLIMVGAGFLQMSRAQRRSVQMVDTRHQDYEGSILRFIAEILAADTVDPETGEFAPTGLDAPPPQERYDYPWTNPTLGADLSQDRLESGHLDGAYSANITQAAAVVPGVPSNHSVGDGPLSRDDAWLASIEPDNLAAEPTWPHLTNLRGVFLDLDDIIDVKGDGSVLLPMQHLTTGDDHLASGNTDIRISDMLANPGRFADADADGIPDSRWTWAPLANQLGRRYIMAVRIVDNSAMADLNTWNALTTGSAYAYTADPTQMPNWYWPGELNLHPVVLDDVTSLAGGDAYLWSVLGERGVALTGNRSDASARYRNWLQASRRWGNLANGSLLPADLRYIGATLKRDQASGARTFPAGLGVVDAQNMTAAAEPYQRYRGVNEAEIRWRNGVNRSSDNLANDAVTDIEYAGHGAHEDWWRQNADPVEVDHRSTPYSTVQAFFQNENRKRFTLFAGSADHEKLDLNAITAQAMADAIRDRMADHPRADNPPTGAQGGPHLSSPPDVWLDGDALADALAVAAIDFRDADSTLTKIGSAYGMEYLPFISEIYIQARYIVSSIEDDGNGEFLVTWELRAIEAAVEIVNPWPWPIEIPEGVKLFINDQELGDLRQMIGAAAAASSEHNDPYLAGHELMHLLIDDTGSESWPTYPGTQLLLDPAQYAWPSSGNAVNRIITARLEAPASDGARVVYQRITAIAPADRQLNHYVTEVEYEDDGVTHGGTGYMQFHVLGTGDGLSALTVREADTQAVRRDTTHFAEGGTPWHKRSVLPDGTDPTGELRFDTHAKNANQPNGPDLDGRVADAASVGSTPTPGDEPFLIGNAGVFYRAGDLLRVVCLGPNDTQTVAEVWADVENKTHRYAVADFMLDLTYEPDPNDPEAVAEYVDGRQVNHAAYLLDLFSTLRPNEDGVDNDGNGLVDDETEQLIPGRINLNTASRALLKRALPIPGLANSTSLDGLVDDIILARSTPSARGGVTNRRDDAKDLGLACLGELATTGAASWTDPDAVVDAFADFNEYDPDLGPGGWAAAAHAADGFTRDREEITLPLAALNQVASVRTDIVTAYVVVRAYPADDFTNAGAYTPLEQHHIIATFDRSVIHENRPLPRLIAVAVYRQR